MYLVVILILLSANKFTVSAQGKEETPSIWIVFNKINSKLPGNNISAITMDVDGAIWIAASNRVMKFDGSEWENYKKPKMWGSATEITSIAIDGQRRVWVGNSHNGVGVLYEKDWVVSTSKNSFLPSNKISSIAIDEKGRIWVGTLGGGLAMYNDIIWYNYNRANSDIPSDHVRAIAINESNNIWLGCSTGLVQFDGDSAFISYPGGKYQNQLQLINSIARVPGKGLLLGCGSGRRADDGGLVNVTLGSEKNAQVTFSMIRSGLNSNYITDITYDESNTLWVVGNNLNYLDFKSGADIQVKGGIIRRQFSGWEDVSALFGHFLKSTTEAINNLKGLYSDEESFYLCHDVNGIQIDQFGNKWFATSNGLFVFNREGISFD